MTEPADLAVTRTAYDTVAEEYAERSRDDPFERAMLAAFAETVHPGPVVDLGSGPGDITAHLHSLGVPVSGVDLSPAMVDIARRRHPAVRFEVGTMTELSLADGALAGVVAWYSIIHTPAERLPWQFGEFRRVLAPGGHLLLAFQVGDESLHLIEAFGHRIDLTTRRLPPNRVTKLVVNAGFEPVARLVREPAGKEKVPQAYLLFRVPA